MIRVVWVYTYYKDIDGFEHTELLNYKYEILDEV